VYFIYYTWILTPDVTMFLYNYNGVIIYTDKMENYTNKTTTKTKQLNKHKTKQSDKKQTKRYYVTFISLLIRALIQTVLY
jgi:hypothetical protein